MTEQKQKQYYVNFLVDLNQEVKIENKKESGLHIHPWGYMGASGGGGCDYLNAHKIAGRPMPKKVGLQLETGAMDVGTIHHVSAQEKLVRKYEQHKELTCVCEAYCKLRITDSSDNEFTVNVEDSRTYKKGTVLPNRGMIAVSPIDMLAGIGLDNDLVELQEYQFRGEKHDLLFIKPDAFEKIVQTGDIKSASQFSFDKMLKEGLPFKYCTQGHIYMKGTDQKTIDFMIINKVNYKQYIIRLHWNEDTWDSLCVKTDDAQRMAIDYLMNGTMEPEPCNLGCLDKTQFNWYGCTLCETIETKGRNGQKLELQSLCKEAQPILYANLKRDMPIGSRWRFGRSIIDIENYYDRGEDGYTVEMVEYINTTNRRKKDKGEKYDTKFTTIINAFFKFDDLDKEIIGFPSNQILIKSEIVVPEECTKCVYYRKKRCMMHGDLPSTFPTKPDWCYYGIKKK